MLFTRVLPYFTVTVATRSCCSYIAWTIPCLSQQVHEWKTWVAFITLNSFFITHMFAAGYSDDSAFVLYFRSEGSHADFNWNINIF